MSHMLLDIGRVNALKPCIHQNFLWKSMCLAKLPWHHPCQTQVNGSVNSLKDFYFILFFFLIFIFYLTGKTRQNWHHPQHGVCQCPSEIFSFFVQFPTLHPQRMATLANTKNDQYYYNNLHWTTCEWNIKQLSTINQP